MTICEDEGNCIFKVCLPNMGGVCGEEMREDFFLAKSERMR